MTPWKNGTFFNPANTRRLMKVDGKSAKWYSVASLDFPDMPPITDGEWIFGDFGEAKPQIKEAAGGKIDRNNLEINLAGGMFKSQGILSQDGTKAFVWGVANNIEIHEWMDDEKLENLKRSRENIKTCSVPYKIQPENVGKIVWLSGPGGTGKSTTCQLLARNAGFVYYEADCSMDFLNPFVPTDVDNPTIACIRQPPLTGFTKEMVNATLSIKPLMDALAANNLDVVNFDDLIPMWTMMAENIDFQHKRIGGDFAIAHGVANRKGRDSIRMIIPNVIFVVLNLTKGALKKRLIGRHGEEAADSLVSKFIGMLNKYEPKGDDEPNTFQVDITEHMTPHDVMEKVLELISK